MGSLDAPLCRICKKRHGLLEKHVWDDEPKHPEPTKPAITQEQVVAAIASKLPPAEAKQFAQVVDRIGRRREQIRLAVQRHRLKAKKAKAITEITEAAKA